MADVHCTANRKPAAAAGGFIGHSQRSRVRGTLRGVQAKLNVSQPGDPAEREAERVAHTMTAAPGWAIQRKCGACEEEDLKIQRKGPGSGNSDLAVPDDFVSSLGGGQPLEAGPRDFFEPRFGAAFGDVRVHTGAAAAESARALNARAYTLGNHIVFGAGEYQAQTDGGKRLLAHELTHVVQQSGAGRDRVGQVEKRGGLSRFSPDAGQSVMAKARQPLITLQSAPQVQKQVDETASEPAVEPAQQEQESPGFWGTVGGGLMGEFNEDPSFAMIGVDTGVSLVPILDQASDVRDIVAHLYYMTVRSQYSRFMRWLGLVFSLIGLFPEIGSAIKGASKFIIKGAREVLSHIGDLLRPIRAILPDISDIGRFQRYVATRWEQFVAFGTAFWSMTLARGADYVQRIPRILGSLRRRVSDALVRIRELTPSRLSEAFAWVRSQFDNVLNQVRERLGFRGRRAGTEIEEDLEQSFQKTFTETVQPPASLPGPSIVPPERAAGFAAAHVGALNRLLAKPLTNGDMAIFGNLWQQAANAGEAATLTLANSRRLFDNHRNRFWRAVANDPQARVILTNAGCVFGSAGTAPFYRLPSGQEVLLTIDHIVERQLHPGRALDPSNLRMAFLRENTVVLRLLNQLDPFQ